jgi:hypothetical protein
MSAPSGRRSESELLKHRELKEAASPQRTATMCAEAGEIGSRRIPNIKNACFIRAFFLVYQALFGNSPSSRLVRLQPLNICFCQAFLFSLLLSSFLFARKEKRKKGKPQ